MPYKWSNPHEWLLDKSQEWNEKQLRVELMNLAFKHDSDTLQDIYESDMDKDGYFEEE